MIDYLANLLAADEKIHKYAGFPKIKKYIADELKALEAAILAPKAVPSVPQEEAEPPIFPEDSGVIETDTPHKTPASDRRV